MTDPYQFDEDLRRQFASDFIGVDEAGRGPLAGPVAAAAVILASDHPIKRLRDSKIVPEREREELFEQIVACAVSYAITFSDVDEIEEKNILQAALSAMKNAVLSIGRPLPVVVDGNKPIPGIENLQVPLVKGDSKSASVAAASILAKVSRDRYMYEMDKKYPQYGFKTHKGYGTPEHLHNLKIHGPCEIHRKSFKGVLV